MITELKLQSKDSGKLYTIKVGKDGNVYCNCPSWKFQHKPVEERRCKHFAQAMAELRKKG